jgi:hypothetical protein
LQRTGWPAGGGAGGQARLAGRGDRKAACQAFGIEARPMSRHFPVGIYAIPEISMVDPQSTS